MAESSADAVPEVGDGLPILRGRYRLTSPLADGGMARVYLATDEVLGRPVAIKVFRASATADDDFARQQAEISVLARLSHPNLITLLDAAIDRTDPENPRIYYVMELVEGTDLKRLLDETTLTSRQVARLGYYIAAGLEHVHRRGIVHRDVKPANVMIGEQTGGDLSRSIIKLGDFGIASIGPATPISEEESVSGTVAYFSPEQAQGLEVGTSSDIYSLGLVLLQCFTGRLAFPGLAVESALARLLDDPDIPRDLPEDWRRLLGAMTARDPAERPDARDVASALRQMFASEGAKHRAPDAPEEPEAPEAPEEPDASESPASPEEPAAPEEPVPSPNGRSSRAPVSGAGRRASAE